MKQMGVMYGLGNVRNVNRDLLESFANGSGESIIFGVEDDTRVVK